MTYELLASAVNHPDSEHPYRGLFNKRTLHSLADREDCSVTVFAPVPYAPPVGPNSEYGNVPVYESFPGYDVVRPRFPYLVPKSLLYAATGRLYRRRIRRATAGTDADLLHGCHVFPDGYGLTAVGAARELPVTVTCHGHFMNNFSELPPGVATYVRQTLDAASHVFCVSEAIAGKARSLTNSTPVSTVPIGAEPENFPTDEEGALRRKRSIPRDTSIVLFCGQFIERKGIGDVVAALERFPDDDTQYIFVGHKGDLLEELRAAAQSPTTPENIRLLSELDTQTLREWYAIADLLMLPSYQEGRPTVIYEAMAAETAVLSTEIEGVTEQVRDGETGVLIEPGDRTALVEELDRLTANRDVLDEMGERARDRLRSNGWTWTDHASDIAAIHQDLV